MWENDLPIQSNQNPFKKNHISSQKEKKTY